MNHDFRLGWTLPLAPLGRLLTSRRTEPERALTQRIIDAHNARRDFETINRGDDPRKAKPARAPLKVGDRVRLRYPSIGGYGECVVVNVIEHYPYINRTVTRIDWQAIPDDGPHWDEPENLGLIAGEPA